MLLGIAFIAGGLFIAFFKKMFVDIVIWVNKWELVMTQGFAPLHNLVGAKSNWYAKVLPGASVWIGAFLFIVGLFLIFN